MDDLDLHLVEALRLDGRASNRALAAELGVNEVTVANRIRRLAGESIIRVVALTDMLAFGHEFLAFAFIRVAGRPVVEVATELSAIQELMSVSVTSGRADVIASALARDREHLSALVGGAIAKTKGVEGVSWELALDIVRFDSDWGALSDTSPSEPWAVTDRVDDKDLEIIRELQTDARASNRAIAGRLGVSEGAVRTRIRRMEQEKMIRIQAVSDIVAFGITAYAYVGISAEPGKVDAVAKQLMGLGAVAAIMKTAGEFELLMLVATGTREELVDLVLNRLGRMRGIRRTETFEAFGTFKHSYTWARIL